MEATDTPGDALSAALLPVLMHQLNGATQVLTSLSAVLNLPDGERWLREKANPADRTYLEAENAWAEREMAANQEPSRREMGREKFLDRVWQQKVKSRGTIIGQEKGASLLPI